MELNDHLRSRPPSQQRRRIPKPPHVRPYYSVLRERAGHRRGRSRLCVIARVVFSLMFAVVLLVYVADAIYALSPRRSGRASEGKVIDKAIARALGASNVVSLAWGSSVYSTWKQPSWARCASAEAGSAPIVVRFVSGGEPDARIYYARDLFVFETRIWYLGWWPPLRRLAEVAASWQWIAGAMPLPSSDGVLSILYTEESSEHEPILQSDVSARRFNFYLSTDPRPLPEFIFESWGFAMLAKRLRTSISPISARGRVVDGDGLVVWVAQNCEAKSRRLEYLQRIAAAGVPVHSLGKCWRTHEVKSSGGFRGLAASSMEEEWQAMGAKYKFWFAAENFLCDGYVTEKFWVPFAFGSVPVLFGSNSSHAEFAPAEDSFVDARHFSSPEALAVHLLAVDRDDTLYMRYHAWRQRPLRELNPNFVELLERSKWGSTKAWRYAPSSLSPDEHKHALAAMASNSVSSAADALALEDAPEWACHVGAEVLQRREATVLRGEAPATLSAMPPCNDPEGNRLFESHPDVAMRGS